MLSNTLRSCPRHLSAKSIWQGIIFPSWMLQPGDRQIRLTVPRHHGRAQVLEIQERPSPITQHRFLTISFSLFIHGWNPRKAESQNLDSVCHLFSAELITFLFSDSLSVGLKRETQSLGFAAGWKQAEQTNPSFPIFALSSMAKWFRLQIMSDIFEILKLWPVCLLLLSIFSVTNRAEVWRVKCLLWWLMKFVFSISLLGERADSNERLNVDILSQHSTHECVCKHPVDILSLMKRSHWRERLFDYGTLHQLNNKSHH